MNNRIILRGFPQQTLEGGNPFDMRAVAAATEDLFHFILSEKGRRVRIFLVKDIVGVVDSLLEGQAMPCSSYDKQVARDRTKNQEQAVVKRLVSGLKSLWRAMELAPEVWTATLIRLFEAGGSCLCP